MVRHARMTGLLTTRATRTREANTMTRLTPINPAEATGKARELLSAVEGKLRFTPNMMRTMAISPAVLDGYLCFSTALGGALGAKLREQIALALPQANR